METFSALLAICAGNSPKASKQSFDVFFDLRLNKRMSKQSWGWWFEMLSRPLWRHRNEKTIPNGLHFLWGILCVSDVINLVPLSITGPCY